MLMWNLVGLWTEVARHDFVEMFNIHYTIIFLKFLEKSKQGLETRRLVLMLVTLASQFINLDSKFTNCVAAPPISPGPPKFDLATVAPLNVPWSQKGHSAPGWKTLITRP